MFEMSLPWWEIVLRGVLVYVFMLVLIRLTGKRQIGQMSPYDLILLLILSNAAQSSMIGEDSSLPGGMISALTLVAVNYAVGLLTYKSRSAERLIEGRAQIVIHDGKVFDDVMRGANITQEELMSTLREAGFFDLREVRLAVLENNGKVTAQGFEECPKGGAPET